MAIKEPCSKIEFAPNGRVGVMKRVTDCIEWDGSRVNDEVQHYCYYVLSEVYLFDYSVKYIVEPSVYARLAAVVSDPLNASDSVLAPYATKYLVYGAGRLCPVRRHLFW